MSERLTAKQVAAELERAAVASRDQLRDVMYAYQCAAHLIREHLVPQWQAEPSVEGEYHVEGAAGVRELHMVEHDGKHLWWAETEYLNGRRVCLVSPPPDAGPAEQRLPPSVR